LTVDTVGPSRAVVVALAAFNAEMDSIGQVTNETEATIRSRETANRLTVVVDTGPEETGVTCTVALREAGFSSPRVEPG